MAVLTPPPLASEIVGHIGSFEIRNTMLMAWLAMVVLTLLSLATAATRYKLIPGRFQTFMEIIVEEFFLFSNSIMRDEKMTRRIYPLVATIFLFIIVGNWMGILPGVSSTFINGTVDGQTEAIPLFRSMNADVNMTLAIALISVIAAQILGVASLGFRHYTGRFFVPPWKDPIGTFVGLLELVSEFSRLVAFTFRLFGNIFAGEVLLIVVAFFIPYIAPVPFLGLEIFVGFIQALVFAMLTLVFLKMAMTSHHEAEEHSLSHA